MEAPCNCPKKHCERHGDCERCEAYHQERKRPPYCRRSSLKKTVMAPDQK